MEEKERYEVISPSLNGYAYIHDFKTDNVLNTYDSCDLLNQQNKRIKELEEELDDAKRDYIPKLEFGLQRANKMCRDAEKENQQLKQSQKQLAIEELEKLREYIVLNDEYDEEIGCNIIKTFDLIEDLADKIKSLKGEE